MRKNIFKIVMVMAAAFMPFMANAQSGYEIYKTNGEKVVMPYSEVDSIVFKSNLHLAENGMISNCSTTKTSVSYRINVLDGETYRHTYIEGWYYDYMMDLYKQQLGEEFDRDVIIKNMLADYGHDATGTQEFTWTAGEENNARNDIVRLVAGKDYYVIASYFNPQTNEWNGTPEAQRVTMAPAGKSASTVNIEFLEENPNSVLVCMHPDQDVQFYFYDFYKKDDFDMNVAEKGQEWIENYLFEYAYPTNVEYTERWTTEPETGYVVAVFGVDKNGDTFYASKDVITPAVKQELKVTMQTYDRPDEGMLASDALKIDVDATTLKSVYGDAAMELFMPKATLDETLSMIGFSMDLLRQAPEYVSYVGATPLAQESLNELLTNGKFTSVRSELEPETEYAYLLLIPTESGYFLGEAYATTEAVVSQTAEPEYAAFLGEWTVKGKSTEDYASEKIYNIRIEQDIVNKSFKIYGWGDAPEVQNLGFTARYDSATKKMYIDGYQDFGTINLDGADFALKFCGMIMQNGELIPTSYNEPIYEAKCNGTHMSLFPNFVNGYEVASMAFVGEMDGVFVAIPGDENSMVSFTVDKK